MDPSGQGLHDIWGAGNTTAQAWASLGVVALFALGLVAYYALGLLREP